MSLLFEGFRLSLASFVLEMDARLDAHVTAIFGPSGAGKTSLLEAVAGLRRPAAGRLILDGRPLDDVSARVHVAPRERAVGYVTQDDSLFPHLSVRDNLRYGAGRETGAAPDEELVLAVLGIEPLLARRPATLSGGERRRVAMGRALLSKPGILLLDEPLSGLERPLRARVLEHLVRVRESFPIQILYVTHDPEEVLALADEVLVLEEGRLVSRGAPASLLTRP